MEVQLGSNITINIPVPGTPGPTAQAETTAPPVLPGVGQLLASGDPGAMLAALTMQAGKAQQEISRTQRDHAEQMQQADEAKEIQDLRDKANLVRIQGVVAGATQMASAAMNFDAGMNDARSAGDTAEANAEKADMEQHPDDFKIDGMRTEQQQSINRLSNDAAQAKADGATDKLGADALGAAGKTVDAIFQGAIADKDTDSKVHDMAAQSAKRMVDDARDNEKDAKDLIAKALEFYKDYTQAKDQTTLAALHRA